jgi:hypothetical protein
MVLDRHSPFWCRGVLLSYKTPTLNIETYGAVVCISLICKLQDGRQENHEAQEESSS